MPIETYVNLVSDDMKNAFMTFQEAARHHFGDFPNLNLDLKESLRSPYTFWFHCRRTGIIDGLPSNEKELMKLLTDWIDENYEEEYSETESLFQKGLVTSSTMPYLIAPGEVFIFQEKSHDRAYKAKSWPHHSDDDHQWHIDAWTYRYDGKFWNYSEELNHCDPYSRDDAERSVYSLSGMPLRFETEERRLELKERGHTYWKYRCQRLISYQSQDTDEQLSTLDARYMVDFTAYRGLHSNRPGVNDEYLKIKPGDFEVFDLTRDDGGPKGDELMLFPPRIKGFDMHGKLWRDLDVDCIQEVQWRQEAFDHLVIDEDTKDLIQALITNRIASSKNTDWIGSKGNGFIMLLHGGPGTGKTFTAESVAELAQKPLYAVTCGDMGTKPEAVEKHLQSNLSLGKRWDCVVLLDEADVFLEQRTLNDLKRNALVCVFLRVIEYYEGIMVLTSNRVGVFDEAFKSRIQLALRYDNLGKAERTKVWRNFFSRLRLIGEENIDYDTVESYIEELAEYEMNGRQIRIAITTARQLAQFKKKPMTWGHLRHVIKVAEKFDNYLKGVHEEMSDDMIARGEGVR
ncbi:hypothetical protein INS49_014220 [Diaporthe citri]|uniref:uncharacterized protein n=1 Tax=Diaporthe citri TaxID=83186 RepID=UPI001C81929B|nr:uncharacterized protein INS49_014220 [Diaporthe citri]KAG6358336.1 hypothetical protein INS49_014220 [Diaporthe citri]